MATDEEWEAAIKDQKNWTLHIFTVTSPIWREKRCPFAMPIQGDVCFCRYKFGHEGDHKP